MAASDAQPPKFEMPDLSAPAVGGEAVAPPQATDRAFARLGEISEAAGAPRMLRVAVEGGGCSGFQYDLRLEDAAEPDDLVLEQEGRKILIDPVSLPFLSGAVIDFTEELIGARFVIENPNVTSSCGCGTSFSV